MFNFGELLESFFSFVSGGSDENDQAGLLKLRRLFAPFVLRRLKADVLDQLTDKTSHVRPLKGQSLCTRDHWLGYRVLFSFIQQGCSVNA